MERELEAAVDSMSWDKRNKLPWKLDECEEMDGEATSFGSKQAQGTVLQTERQERFRYHLNVI